MTILNLSLAQFHIEIGQPWVNLEKAAAMISTAAQNGSQIILLPELWSSGYDLSNRQKYAQINQEILDHLQTLANEQHIWIGGSFLTQASESFFNSFVMIEPGQGPLQPVYHKIHLFRLLEEEYWLTAGDLPVTLEYSEIKMGLSICYDLRFAELFRQYQSEGVGLCLNVAQWGASRREHWLTLLRSRAIENQFFMAAADACGSLRDKDLAGSSAIITPWGETLAEASPTEEELITAQLNLDLVAEVRHRIPAARDNRKDLYSKWYQS